MPRFALKRRETLVKFVRRAALGHLDAAGAALRAGAEGGKRSAARVGRARRELLRLRALLRLVRGPLGSAAFSREHAAVQRLVRRIAPYAEAAGVDRGQARKPAPGPALLRALADLAEIRVRAKHWHVPAAGFDGLAPALRSAWRQATRPVTGPRAVVPAALADAALTLHDQLRCVERAWPEAIDAPRQLAKDLAAAAGRWAALSARAEAPAGGDRAGPPKQLAEDLAQTRAEVDALTARLRAETPAAFTRRLSAYWELWRSPAG